MSTNKKQEQALNEMVQNLTDIDALGALIIASAGVAGLMGVRGPLTTMMSALEGMFGGTAEDISMSSKTGLAGPSWLQNMVIAMETPFLLIVSPQTWFDWLGGKYAGDSQQTSSLTPDQQKLFTALIGNAAGNMVEAGLMYTLFRNPDTLKTFAEMAKQAANGALGLGKAGAGLLAKA
jgi:hypothetical protein